MDRTRRILTHGWIGASALNLFTGGYYPQAEATLPDLFVYGWVVGPGASGLVKGPDVAGDVAAPNAYGVSVGPKDTGTVKGPGETAWH